MPTDDYINPWDENGENYPGWNSNQWGGQPPPAPGSDNSPQETAGKTEDLTVAVKPDVPYVAQSSTNRCWAASATMMVSWRERKPLTVEDVLTRPEAKLWYDDYYTPNTPLPDDEYVQFGKAIGLNVLPGQTFSDGQLSEMLKKHGPVIFNLSLTEGARVTHNVVLYAIYDLPPNYGWHVEMHDPGDPDTKPIPLAEFHKVIENVAAKSKWIAAHFP
jgi:hypothetical protein